MRFVVFCLFALSIMSVDGFSQSSSSSGRKKSTDSTNDIMMSVEFNDRTPTISLFYGSAMLTREGIAGTIENDMVLGGTLGMERELAWWRDENIVVRHANNLYMWYGKAADAQGITTPMNGDVPAIAATSAASLFRIGFLDESGFGYSMGASSNITFLASSGVLSWTVVTPQATTADPASAQALRDFEGSLRFGEAMRPAIDWRIAQAVSLRAGFEWSQIYPRHMFWYWALSQTIEGIADAGATWFAREIGKSSPGAMPIVYFLLKNGVAAGFKALRMNQMNWPFTTEAPLNVYQWNIGANIHF